MPAISRHKTSIVRVIGYANPAPTTPHHYYLPALHAQELYLRGLLDLTTSDSASWDYAANARTPKEASASGANFT